MIVNNIKTHFTCAGIWINGGGEKDKGGVKLIEEHYIHG
jgi:hypothetical protein